jgi:hypothetical protein
MIRGLAGFLGACPFPSIAQIAVAVLWSYESLYSDQIESPQELLGTEIN